MKKFNYHPPLSPIQILHQDDDIIVINKPSGLLSNPGIAPETKDCAVSRLQQELGQAILVHRLDCETSGVMVFAKNKQAESHLKKQFEARQTRKVYLAEVDGTPKQLEGSIKLALIADKQNVPLQKVDQESGKEAVTHYRVLQTSSTSSLIELKPVTGRTHQLRVHLLSIGHTILGDNFYANDRVLNMRSRLCLHAMSLSFTHPTTNKQVSYYCPANFE